MSNPAQSKEKCFKKYQVVAGNDGQGRESTQRYTGNAAAGDHSSGKARSIHCHAIFRTVCFFDYPCGDGLTFPPPRWAGLAGESFPRAYKHLTSPLRGGQRFPESHDARKAQTHSPNARFAITPQISPDSRAHDGGRKTDCEFGGSRAKHDADCDSQINQTALERIIGAANDQAARAQSTTVDSFARTPWPGVSLA